MPAPEKFGRYKVLELLGSGAMGEVYKAVDSKVYDRVVAIKVLLERLAANKTSVQRFETEVKTAATLDHPNIVSIFDRGDSEDGRPYFVMEHLEGFDLRQLTTGKEERTLEFLIDLGSQIADALDYAHNHGVVHRDVKPSNIFVVRRGEDEYAKLLDFGIVHVEGSNLTQTTEQPGTYNYMAPEVMRGVEADKRSDLFSLGIVLYELFSHEHPFQAPTQPLMLGRILDDSPKRPRKVNPDIPSSLESIILKLLEKDPNERPPRARDVVAYMRQIAGDVRFAGSTGTPSGVSADEVTAQTVRALKQRARQFESDGRLEEALSLREKVVALVPDDSRARSKVETLQHEIQRRRKVSAQIERAKASLASGDPAGAREAWNDAWLVAPNDPQVLEMRARIEEAEEDGGGATVGSALAPAVEQAVQAYNAGKGGEARKQLIEHIRSNPDDRSAAKLLDDILAGRDVSLPGATSAGSVEPEGWSASDRHRLDTLESDVRAARAAADACGSDLRSKLDGLGHQLAQLSQSAPVPQELDRLADAVHSTIGQIGTTLLEIAKGQARELARIREGAEGTLSSELLGRARQVEAGLDALDAESAVVAGSGVVEEAFECRKALDEAVKALVGELRREVESGGTEGSAALARRLDAWAEGVATEPLVRLVEEIRQQGSARASEIAEQIHLWVDRIEGSGAMEAGLLRRFTQIAEELKTDSGGADAARMTVAVDALGGLKTAHADAVAKFESERSSLVAQIDEVAEWLPADGRQSVAKLKTAPWPDELRDARSIIDALERHLAEGRAGREQLEATERRRLDELVANAREVAGDPWLEDDVLSPDDATSDSERLIAAARAASEAGHSLTRAVATASEESVPLPRRVEGVVQATEQARQAAAASREKHEAAVESWSTQRSDLLQQVESWKDEGLPEQLRSRAARIRVPSSSPGKAPVDLRLFVQGLSGARVAIDDLQSRIDKLGPAVREEAEELLRDIEKYGKGPRFPRVSAELQERLALRGRELSEASRGDRTDLVELIRVVELTRDDLDEVPANRLPWIAGAVALLLTATTAWLLFAPRTVTLVPGLGAVEVWLTPARSEEKLEFESKAGGAQVYSLGRGRYTIHHRDGSGDASGTKSNESTVTIGLTTLPVPFGGTERSVGDDPQERMFDLLKERFPELLQN